MKRKEKATFESPERLNRLVEGSKVVGDLFVDSSLRIDGEVQGNVMSSSKVVVGENGNIVGNLNCVDADVEGTINGVITCEGLLILREKATITGDILTVRIQIEEGASFNGKCQMDKASNADRVNIKEIERESSVVY